MGGEDEKGDKGRSRSENFLYAPFYIIWFSNYVNIQYYLFQTVKAIS